MKKKTIFVASLKSLKTESDPELNPDLLVRGADPRGSGSAAKYQGSPKLDRTI
jgi:hypothetical protein